MPPKMRKTVSKTTRLERQIETAIEDLRQNYKETLNSVTSLKKKVNELELRTNENGSTHADANRKKLNLAVNELDQLIDSAISQAAKKKQRCEKLKLDCSTQSHAPAGLKELLTLCVENEQLAKDLLCYSLGRLNK